MADKAQKNLHKYEGFFVPYQPVNPTNANSYINA